jgi:hypothetical protein
MTLWWIGDAVLALVVAPVVVYLLWGVLAAANGIVPAVWRISAAAKAGSRDLDAVPLLLTTQEQVSQTIGAVAYYGGSLAVVLDDVIAEDVNVADVNVTAVNGAAVNGDAASEES